MQINNPTVIRNGAILAVGIGVSGGLGYVIGVKRTAAKFETLLNEEIASVKEAYRNSAVIQSQSKPFATPQEAAAALIPAEGELEPVREEPEHTEVVQKILEYQGSESSDDPQLRALIEESETTHNVFDQPDRSAEKPYIISVDEFIQDEEVEGITHDKITITYWEGDDTLMDERESIIPDIEGVVGSINLTMFGEENKKYSQDPNIVYVRNERIHTDFEVVREEGSYSVTVLGMDPDVVEGNEKRPVKKMRPDG